MTLVKQNKTITKSTTMTFGEKRELDKARRATHTPVIKRVNFNLDEDKHARFKAACTRQRTSISEVLSNYIDQWLIEYDS